MSANSVNDERRGAIFPATLTLARSAIKVSGQRVALAPGMNLSAEIKTRQRRVIVYLQSPEQCAAAASLKERRAPLGAHSRFIHDKGIANDISSSSCVYHHTSYLSFALHNCCEDTI
jgi:hypothetical protein